MRRFLFVFGYVGFLLFLVLHFVEPVQITEQLPLINRKPMKEECTSNKNICEIRRFDKGSVQAKVETHKVCVWLKYTLTEEEYELLCRTTFCEAGNQDLETQVMVALTILNRLGAEQFPNTIQDVVYQDDAYEVTEWTDFEDYRWTEQVEQAVKIALMENNHPADMYYFRTEHYHTFGKPYMKSDDLWFSTQE